MVDDNELNLKIGTLQLKQQGMIVDTALNGQTAVNLIWENGVDTYDFILMDVQMPVMDGYEATSIIRKLPGGNKLKILAFSANAFEEDRERSLNAAWAFMRRSSTSSSRTGRPRALRRTWAWMTT